MMVRKINSEYYQALALNMIPVTKFRISVLVASALKNIRQDDCTKRESDNKYLQIKEQTNFNFRD